MSPFHEVVMFHVEDPNPALTFSDTPHAVILETCIRSIRKRSPSSHIVLLTDAHSMPGGIEGVECIRDANLRTEHIMYERSRMYREHVARRVEEKSAAGIVFMDTDIIVNRDLSDIFDPSFDVGLTFRYDPEIVLDAQGLPENKNISPINGGVIFCTPTEAALAFFTRQMEVYDRLASQQYENAGPLIRHTHQWVSDVRKWGGDQMALMMMIGTPLMATRPETLVYEGAVVRFFDCETYNFTPEENSDVTAAMLAPKYLIHMKGPRKNAMPGLAQFLGI